MGNIGSSSTKVREFSISGQKLKLDTAADVSEYVKQLNKAKGLEIVNLSGNTLGLEACKAIAAALEGHLTLQEVNLSDCFTGRLKEHVPPSIEAFGKVLADKPNLKIIDFSDNAFSPAGATALSYFLANCTSLEELRLNNNGLGPEGGKIIANGLKENRRKSQASGKVSVLRRVTIGRNRLENGSATELAEAFSLHENLEDVALFQNGIRPEGIVALAQGLSKCLKLKALDLQDNTFTAKGSKAVAEAIPAWTEMSQLNIGDCLLSDEGCREILEKLVKSSASASKLTVLNLQYAEMEGETAEYLAQNLKIFSGLEKLFLNGNCFAPTGKESTAIKSGLLPTTTLDELDDMDFEEDESDEEVTENKESEGEEAPVKLSEVVAKAEDVTIPVSDTTTVPVLDTAATVTATEIAPITEAETCNNADSTNVVEEVTENISSINIKEDEVMVPEVVQVDETSKDTSNVSSTESNAEVTKINSEVAESSTEAAELNTEANESNPDDTENPEVADATEEEPVQNEVTLNETKETADQVQTEQVEASKVNEEERSEDQI